MSIQALISLVMGVAGLALGARSLALLPWLSPDGVLAAVNISLGFCLLMDFERRVQ